MYRDLKRNFWWNGMKKEIAEYVSRCQVCQQVKVEHQRLGGLLKPLEIPMWKWKHITMDFVIGLPKSKSGKNTIWVVVDRLTKFAYFSPMRATTSMDELVKMYMKDIV
jgi:hypothetical protein